MSFDSDSGYPTKKYKFTQCLLKKDSATRVSFIPSKYAIVDSIIALKDKSGNWSDGWQVIEKYEEMEKDDLLWLGKEVRRYENGA